MITVLGSWRFGLGEQGNSFLREGWAEPEPGFVWAVGDQSRLVVPVRAHRGRLRVFLDIVPFRAGATRYQRIAVYAEEDHLRTFRVGCDCVLPIDLPGAGGPTALWLVVKRMERQAPPSAVGLAEDRDLVFRVSRLTVIAEDPAVPATPAPCLAEFPYGALAETEGTLTHGWADPERDFVWAIGRNSRLDLPLPGADMSNALVLLDFRPPAPHMRVAIGLNDRLSRYVHLRERIVLALPMPPTERDTLRIGFDNLDAAGPLVSPHHVSGQNFAFALHSVRILPSTPAAEPARLPPHAGALEDGGLNAASRRLLGRDLAEIASQFEAISSGCGLGLLQRALGRERPGLLRYAALRQPLLVEGIFNGFDEIGRPDRLEWTVRHASDGTWRLVDQTHEATFPTAYPLTAPPPPAASMAPYLCRLAEKLREDLREATRVFAVRLPHALDEQAAVAVLAALRAHGPNRLLWLRDDWAGVPGSAELLASGVVVGHIDPGDAQDVTLASVLINAAVLLGL